MTQWWQYPGDSPIHVCQRGMGHGPWAYMSSLRDQPGAPLGKLGLFSGFQLWTQWRWFALFRALRVLIVQLLSSLLSNRDHFRLWEPLGEMAVGSGKWFSVLLNRTPDVPVLGSLLSPCILKQQLLNSHCNFSLLMGSIPLNPAVVVQLFAALISNRKLDGL